MINNLPEHEQVRTITETCLNFINLTILLVSGLEKNFCLRVDFI
ncbi:MAG: hypothetical protein ACTSRI_05840 [Promethearchaeota archaeon]